MRVICTLLGTVALTLAFGTSAIADAIYSDPAGDVPGGLDVTGVTITNDLKKNTITFNVALAGAPDRLGTNYQQIEIFIDSDHDPSTGDTNEGGSEYVMSVQLNGYWFEKWDPDKSEFVVQEHPDSNFDVTYWGSSGLTWTLSPLDIEATQKSFNFYVFTWTPNPDDADNPFEDYAPDEAVWSYSLPSPTVTTTVPAVSGTAKAGGTYAITSLAVYLSNGRRADAKNLKCTATLGGAGFGGTGPGRCTFKLPKTAKGKTLVVHIAGTVGGTKVGSVETVRVR